MPRFLAVYMMKPEAVARFRQLPKSEQDAIDAVGLKKWTEWERANATSFPEAGGMVGKTKRVTKTGVADAQNEICGYVVVRAENIEAAAALFQDHPHFSVFPSNSVDIMPFVTGPQD